MCVKPSLFSQIYQHFFQIIMSVGQVSFQDSWLEKVDKMGEEYKNWLLPDFNNSAEAICVICFWKRIDIREGVREVNRHAKSRAHMQKIKILHEKKVQDAKVCLPSLI